MKAKTLPNFEDTERYWPLFVAFLFGGVFLGLIILSILAVTGVI